MKKFKTYRSQEQSIRKRSNKQAGKKKARMEAELTRSELMFDTLLKSAFIAR